jgi:hypothetical protein
MLRELNHPRQNDGDPFRRVFMDEYFELFVWYGDQGEEQGFQLCYDLGDNPRALTYVKGLYTHAGIDQGEASPLKNLTPMLVVDGAFPKFPVLERFARESVKLDPKLLSYMTEKLKACPDTV